jgi:hypothetical protein
MSTPTWLTLPPYILEGITHERTCDCGRRAVWLGRFESVTATGSRIGNAMLLCEECAADVDAGVKLERLKGRMTG